MIRKTFSEGMAIFTACFKDFKVTDSQVKVWFKLLEGLDDNIFLKAVEHLASNLTNLYPGSNIVGLIKEEAGKIDGTGMSLDTKAMLAYDKVIKAIHDVDAYGSPQFDDKIIHAVIERLGGWVKACSVIDTEKKWWRKEFEQAYKQYDGMRDRIDAPKHLTGIHEQNNSQRFPTHVPEPVRIGTDTVERPALSEGDGAEILRKKKAINHN